MNKFLEQAIAIKDDIISYRRHIHENPEVGVELPMTKKFVMDKLREFGYEPNEICESGIVATIEGSKPGKTFLLRADMDAVYTEENTGCSFASKNGAMHSCGHDMHTAMLLGAAKILKQNVDEIEGTIKLVFQPDEEGFTGSKSMIKAGVLENPKVDAAMAMHVNSPLPTNLALFATKTFIGGCTKFKIVVKGKGCHTARPELGIDPINIACHINIALQTIVHREIRCLDPVVIGIGKFVGGESANIIPGEVVMEGTLRTVRKEVAEEAFNRMRHIVESTAKTFGGEAELIEICSVPPLNNDKDLLNQVSEYAKDIVGEQGVVFFDEDGMGAEDFASYGYEVPSLYIVLGAGAPNENPEYGQPMHSPNLVFNEDVLPTGTALYVDSAINWLKNNK